MAKHLFHSDIIGILTTGAFDDLKGALEDEHLECKAQPYQLQHEHQRYELAKDVAMIVNRLARAGGEGGHILLGVRTEKAVEHHGDMVVDVSFFEQSLVDPKQYHDVLQTWLLPEPKDLDVLWYPSAGNGARGIVAITIGPQPPDRWPCIVTKVLEPSEKITGSLIAYFERRGEHGVGATAAELQRWICDGARGDALSRHLDAVAQRIEVVSDDVRAFKAQLTAAAAPAGPSEAMQAYSDRLREAITAVGLDSTPSYVLIAIPVQTTSLPGLFRGRDEPLVKLLENPPSLRDSGFDLDIRADLDVVRGQLRRAARRGRGVLECWQDGTLIFAMNAEFLCWGPKTKGHVLRINPLALAESTLLFATVALQVYTQHASPPPKEARFGIVLRGMNVQGGPIAQLSTGGIRSFGYQHDMSVKAAPEGNMEHVIDVETTKTPGEVAFALSAFVYRWFGHTEDGIPYVEGQGADKVVSKDRILQEG